MAEQEYKNTSDTELLVQLKRGNHFAFTVIYDRYFYLMFVFANKKLQDEELTKDFVQELFTNLWNKRESLSEGGKISSYLYISIRSRILDYFAHQKVKTKYIEFLKNYQIPTTEQTDHLIREKDISKCIEMEIRKLPRKMKEVFELSRLENLSHKEIAQRLQISENNVSTQLANALKIFRMKFGGITSSIKI